MHFSRTPESALRSVGVRNAVARLPLQEAMLATDGAHPFERWVACELAAGNTKNPRPADASGIEHFISRHPVKARRGFVVCRCARTERLSPHVLAILWQDL